MLFTTTTQFIALIVALIAGWLLGLASHPGGRRWKQRYADERAAHADLRRDHDTRLAAAQARITELERENSRLANAAPVAPVAPVASVATNTLPGHRDAPRTDHRDISVPGHRDGAMTRPVGEQRGWFDFGGRTRTLR